jgi:hypothetical protein
MLGASRGGTGLEDDADRGERKERKSWTLEGARAVIADVRTRTERAALEVERLGARREAVSVAGPERGALDQRIEEVVQRWSREMEALGLEVKGLWLVDFDNGSGYYCWQWPEETLDHFHSYDEGFAGRTRIQ